MASTNTLPVAEISCLLTELSDHGTQHMVEVEADLRQTTELLSGAIEKLSVSFMAIHTTVSEQQAELDSLLDTIELPKKSIERIAALRDKLSTEVNAAVTGLQFQDMTSQLIERVIRRVSGLRDSLAALAEHGADIDPAHEHEEMVKLLEEISASLNMRNDALKGGLKRAVRQEDMSSGGVELF